MRRFLYITPYFPPQRKVGALRPLKFVRHLPECGWEPVVLCDLRLNDAIDRKLEETVPPNIEIIRNYGLFARYTDWRYRHDNFSSRDQTPRDTRQSLSILGFSMPMINPEFVTLGRHSLDIHHACQAARKRLQHGDIEAIMVNADPFAALLVGRRLALEFNLPLIHDLRDPWAPCDIRRKLRPLPQLRLVDRLERRALESAAKVILNTQETIEAYRKQYSDLPVDRFTLIRNHCDPDLIANGSFPERDVFTLFFLGSFRRFVEGEQIVHALAELKQRGFDSSEMRLLITGTIMSKTQNLAHKLGIESMIENHPFVPYRQVGPFLKTSDLLVLVGHRTRQRIPAKLYDYIHSTKPILAISDNPEIADLAKRIGGISVLGLDDIKGIADAIQNELELGRGRTVTHDATGFNSSTAAERLATILDEVCSS